MTFKRMQGQSLVYIKLVNFLLLRENKLQKDKLAMKSIEADFRSILCTVPAHVTRSQDNTDVHWKRRK